MPWTAAVLQQSRAEHLLKRFPFRLPCRFPGSKLPLNFAVFLLQFKAVLEQGGIKRFIMDFGGVGEINPRDEIIEVFQRLHRLVPPHRLDSMGRLIAQRDDKPDTGKKLTIHHLLKPMVVYQGREIVPVGNGQLTVIPVGPLYGDLKGTTGLQSCNRV